MDEERQNNKYFVPSNTSTPCKETKASSADDVSISPIYPPADENQGGGNEVSDVAEINQSTSSLPTTSRSQNKSDVVETKTMKRKHRKPLELLYENVDLTNLKETKDEFDDLHSSKELSSTVPVKKEKQGFQIYHDSTEETGRAETPVLKVKIKKPMKLMYPNEEEGEGQKKEQSDFEIDTDSLEESAEAESLESEGEEDETEKCDHCCVIC